MQLLVTHPRLTGVGERIAYGVISAILLRLAARGWIPPEMVEYIALGIISGVGGVYAWWLNRPQKILETAANVPNPESVSGKTVIIASPELAAATPAAPTVVSSDDHRVVAK
jgi:CHASE2 domain-containing sensor protein